MVDGLWLMDDACLLSGRVDRWPLPAGRQGWPFHCNL